MEIATLKSQLDICQVADRLDIRLNRNQKALCPFHDDKRPSLQFSKEKQIATCFSGQCSAGTMDVISLVEKKLNVNTHEAIRWLQNEFNLAEEQPAETKSIQTNYPKLFRVFEGNLKKSSKAKAYLEARGLAPGTLEVGYNGTGWEKMKHCVIFPLKDRSGQIVSFYGRRAASGNNGTHYYNTSRRGLYPGYPPVGTETLVLTESVIDAATLLQYQVITKQHTVLALYGTNGLTAEHQEAIKGLTHLKEVILFLDGDEAGKEAIKRNGEILQKLKPEIKLTYVEVPEGEDINSLATSHPGQEKELFAHLIKSRNPFLSSSAPAPEQAPSGHPKASGPVPIKPVPIMASGLNTVHPHRLKYQTETARYYINGGIKKEWDSLRVTLVIEHPATRQKYRNKLDLYENKQVEKTSREASEKLSLRSDLLETDLNRLTDLLDTYRESLHAANGERRAAPELAPKEAQAVKGFLSRPDVLGRINTLIGKSGVVGEETNRLFLFVIASSYKMTDTLHALIQGSTGSGKTHLLIRISELVPKEDLKDFTRVTEGSFYNYGMYELKNKLVCLEDFDGLEEKAQLAMRELQSRGMLSTSSTGQDEQGYSRAYQKIVYGPIASLACTTRGEIYEDNMGRVFLIAVDESREQTGRVISYQNNKAAGLIDKEEQERSRQLLRNIVRMLQPCEVVNPYAHQVSLPREAHKIRRLNELYQSFVKQVTLINQYRRTKDGKGRLITEKEDLQQASEIMFESIVLKIDELDGSLRRFYEQLKAYVKAKGGSHYATYSFRQREIRQALKVSKTQLHRYVHDLLALEYIQITGGHSNRGYQYKITWWDDIVKLRDKVKRHLQVQLDQLLVFQTAGTPDGTPEKRENS